jgi:hypothetical protein
MVRSAGLKSEIKHFLKKDWDFFFYSDNFLTTQVIRPTTQTDGQTTTTKST